MRLYTAEEYAAHLYHLRVGEALSGMAWAMRACFPTWRVGALPGAWDPKCNQVGADMRARWAGRVRSGR
jgi:hypothetical protein